MFPSSLILIFFPVRAYAHVSISVLLESRRECRILCADVTGVCERIVFGRWESSESV